MKYIQSWKVFESGDVSSANIQNPGFASDSDFIGKSRQSAPESYEEFEKMITEKFDFQFENITENKKNLIKEGGALGLLIFGTILSFGKLLELVGEIFKFIVNKGKSWGFIVGEKWETTIFEKWGKWYQKYLIKWVFVPIATLLCNSAQPFIHMMESFINPGELKNYCTKEDIEMYANGIFFITIASVLTLSMGKAGAVLANAMHGKIIATGILKLVTSATKFWELKCLALANMLKKYEPFKNYDTIDISHAIADCLEKRGLWAAFKDTLKFKFKFSAIEQEEVRKCITHYCEHPHH